VKIFDSTLGHPGKGPLKAGASKPMDVDVQAVVNSPSVGSNTAVSPYKLNLNCDCVTNREQIRFRVPVGGGSTWADVCGALKKQVLEELHCGEKCTPTLVANEKPPIKRPHEDNWLGLAAAEKKKRQEEAAQSIATADSERKVTDFVQEIAKSQAARLYA
jgi:hypothetical protein